MAALPALAHTLTLALALALTLARWPCGCSTSPSPHPNPSPSPGPSPSQVALWLLYQLGEGLPEAVQKDKHGPMQGIVAGLVGFGGEVRR